MNEKRALVLPGGGARGAFQVGVLLYLIGDLGQRFDIITGTSVGALNAGVLAQYKKEDQKEAIEALLALWLKVSGDGKIKKHWRPFSYIHALWKSSLFNSSPLHKLVANNISADRILRSGIELSVPAVSLDTGEINEFNQLHPDIAKAVCASAAVPAFFSPVKIGDEHFVDGGVREMAPLNKAISLGATHITIVNTGPLDPVKRKGGALKTFGVALRAIDLQMAEVVRNDLIHFIRINEKLSDKTMSDESKRIIDYMYIGPDNGMISNPLEFNPMEIREMIKEGYDKAKELLG